MESLQYKARGDTKGCRAEIAALKEEQVTLSWSNLFIKVLAVDRLVWRYVCHPLLCNSSKLQAHSSSLSLHLKASQTIRSRGELTNESGVLHTNSICFSGYGCKSYLAEDDQTLGASQTLILSFERRIFRFLMFLWVSHRADSSDRSRHMLQYHQAVWISTGTGSWAYISWRESFHSQLQPTYNLCLRRNHFLACVWPSIVHASQENGPTWSIYFSRLFRDAHLAQIWSFKLQRLYVIFLNLSCSSIPTGRQANFQ